MANKYQLSIVLLLVVLAASIKISPKSKESTPNPPNAKVALQNSASKTTDEANKKSTSPIKEDDSEKKNKEEAKTKEDESKENENSHANTPSKSPSASKNAAKKDTGNKLNSKKTASSAKNDDSKEQEDSEKKQTHNSAKVDEESEEGKAKQEESVQKKSTNDEDNNKGKKSKWSFKKKPSKSKPSSSTDSDDKKQNHERNEWGIFFVYLMIFAVLLFGLKYLYFKDSTVIQMALDIGLLIISFAKNIKDSRYGYKPPIYTEEIDDENSVNVGYGEEHGKQLFWEKNSVEGI